MSFLKVKCPDCSNEQVVFARAATIVKCDACGATLATPTGGTAVIRAEVVAKLE
jgi:small subunit ribosomal protein S27e